MCSSDLAPAAPAMALHLLLLFALDPGKAGLQDLQSGVPEETQSPNGRYLQHLGVCAGLVRAFFSQNPGRLVLRASAPPSDRSGSGRL